MGWETNSILERVFDENLSAEEKVSILHILMTHGPIHMMLLKGNFMTVVKLLLRYACLEGQESNNSSREY